MSNHLLFIGGVEVLIIMLVVVMLFGSKKIPELARGLARGLREMKDASDEIKKRNPFHSNICERRSPKMDDDLNEQLKQ